MTNVYTDEELRLVAMPLAVALVNTEFQRIMNNCNTKSIAEVTAELVSILKTGTVVPEVNGNVAAPTAPPVQEVLPPTQPIPNTMKYA